ncbi:Rieske 2Fe-2S domain-containing protein [Paractinoplanes lichenicola]|uniref:Rieske 2Fe-2S domain-containing protein n=1 Tax=Paractinoplanes lichenicola TaxID=2802976 RepID=UPI001F3F26F1|nr:Rieske 2Fe-2S domain-containing protein [Actinoplanes lichenicola]
MRRIEDRRRSHPVPCHGSQFDAADGSVVNGPAQNSLPRRSIDMTEAGEIISG